MDLFDGGRALKEIYLNNKVCYYCTKFEHCVTRNNVGRDWVEFEFGGSTLYYTYLSAAKDCNDYSEDTLVLIQRWLKDIDAL